MILVEHIEQTYLLTSERIDWVDCTCSHDNLNKFKSWQSGCILSRNLTECAAEDECLGSVDDNKFYCIAAHTEK